MTLNPAPIEEITGPRHAQVLPSFAANLMKRRMQVNGEKVSGEELLAWWGPLPNYIRATAIRNNFVKGHRPRFEVLWNSPIGVHHASRMGVHCVVDRPAAPARRA